MGINTDCARFFMAAKQAGVCFDHTLTLGRQWWFANLNLLREGSGGHLVRPLPVSPQMAWSDEFFRCLGAKELSVMDHSPYEGASLIHDLNKPLPAGENRKYDMVFDGGTLEHVFNFPVAIQTCMSLVKPGGHLCLWTPANNELGHGFYQFGPELFYRLFSSRHGYRITSMVLVESRLRGSRWYSVKDSAELNARVCCVNKYPLFLMVLAQRTSSEEIPVKLDVQQSDYVSAWEGKDVAVQSTRPGYESQKRISFRQRFVKFLPATWVRIIKRYYRHYLVVRLRNKKFYTRIDPLKFSIPQM